MRGGEWLRDCSVVLLVADDRNGKTFYEAASGGD